MAVNGYVVGRDVTLDITTQAGILRPSIRTNFGAKQETAAIQVKRADGVVDFLELPGGWSGSFDYERQDSTLDDFFASLEDTYYSGGNLGAVQITETIQEAAGNVTQYRYDGVVLKYDDAGPREGDKTIKQKISFKASRRRKVA
jgi:hypothetical protein